MKSTSTGQAQLEHNMEPTKPAPLADLSTKDQADYDVEQLTAQPQKRKLKSNQSYWDEWKYGSKLRVLKYYAVHFLIGVVIGAIVGVIIGVCVRYAGK